MGIISPIGNNISEFQSSLIEGKSGIRQIDELTDSGFNCTVGGICDYNFDEIKNIFPELNIPIISKSRLLLAKAAHEALTTSNLINHNKLKTEPNFDIIIGSTIGASDTWGNNIIKKVDNNLHKRLGSYAFEQVINSSPAAMLSGILHTTGRVISNSLACASSTESIIDGVNQIKFQNKNIVLCGGVDPYSKYYWATMDAMRITNRHHNRCPNKSSRPMSNSARGFIPAEGSAVIVLENYEHAKQRDVKIYGEIVGSHINTGGQINGGSMTSANPEMLISCISNAIKSANISANKLDYISGHLTGTKADIPEIKAWDKSLKCKKSDFPYINSTKSMTGHTMGACGAIETIATLLQMENNFIHKSLNCEDLHHEISKIIPKNSIPQKTIKNTKIKYAATANFGFGDVNACLILKNYNE